MPDPLLYGETLAAAALAGLLFGLAVRRRAVRWPADCSAVADALGTALAIAVGFAVLGVRPRLPPQNGLDRLLSVVLPAALVVEVAGTFPRVPQIVATVLRMTCAASAGWILLYGSVYLRPGAGEWTIGEVGVALAFCAVGLYGEWNLVLRLGTRAGDRGALLSLSLAVICAGALVMLAGYLKGGAAAIPLAAALFGGTIARWRAPDRGENRGALGLGVVGLFGLLFIGRFFGGLSTGTALVVFVSPLLGWLPEALSGALPGVVGGERTWRRRALQFALVAIPLVIVLVRAKSEFDRKLGPLIRDPPRALSWLEMDEGVGRSTAFPALRPIVFPGAAAHDAATGRCSAIDAPPAESVQGGRRRHMTSVTSLPRSLNDTSSMNALTRTSPRRSLLASWDRSVAMVSSDLASNPRPSSRIMKRPTSGEMLDSSVTRREQ